MQERLYGYDDVLLSPLPSSLSSRDEVSLKSGTEFFVLDIPIIVSPMKGIVSTKIIKAIYDLGGIGILHRFYEDDNAWRDDIDYLYYNNILFGAAIGLGDERYRDVLDKGAKILCVDIANGYLKSLLDFVDYLRNYLDRYSYNCAIMAGNVATLVGAYNLAKAGADMIRVGIGSGSLCSTRINTGVGVPQISAIQYSSVIKREEAFGHVKIVADGGIINAGNAVKALAAGADFIMLGSLLAATYESSHNGIIYGMASRRLQEEYYHSVKSVEGIERDSEKNIFLKELIEEFVWNMKSAFTYLDSRSIDDLHNKASFIVVNKILENSG